MSDNQTQNKKRGFGAGTVTAVVLTVGITVAAVTADRDSEPEKRGSSKADRTEVVRDTPDDKEGYQGPSPVNGVDIEKGALFYGVGGVEAAASTAELVRDQGYTCDTVSAYSLYKGDDTVNLDCNNFRYEYEIRDQGGRYYLEIAD